MTFAQLAQQAIEDLEDRGVPETIDLIRALVRDNEAKGKRIKALERENDELRYGGVLV